MRLAREEEDTAGAGKRCQPDHDEMKAFDVVQQSAKELERILRCDWISRQREAKPAQQVKRNAGMILHAGGAIELKIAQAKRHIDSIGQTIQFVIGHGPDRNRIANCECRNNSGESNRKEYRAESCQVLLVATSPTLVASLPNCVSIAAFDPPSHPLRTAAQPKRS